MYMLESRKVQNIHIYFLPNLAFSLDYTGEDVTADNFLSVLTGNKAAMQGKGSGKVLESGPNDDGIYFNYCSVEGMNEFFSFYLLR